ncbi:MAG TPA: surface carbohydrate biosynthesis protein [Dongiaceae bacterium]|jgi:surface carbohydrate biosynthesis protein|nr:surface carbohydrate biosynthesis protein [Dongiaceae bacterium]
MSVTAVPPARVYEHGTAPAPTRSIPLSRILYLPMEIASRELDSRLLIAAFALERGYEVVLGQKWLIERNLRAMQPGLYLSKTLTQRDAKFSSRAGDLGYFVTAIDEEMPGLVVKSNELRWVSEAGVDSSNLIFVAGSNNADALRTRFPEAAHKVQAVGNPRLDLLRPQLRPLYRAEAERLRARHGRFILINTNLGFTNSEKGSVDEIVSEQVRLGKLNLDNPEHRAFVEGIKAMEAANGAAITQLLKILPPALPDHRIILRPHPSENLTRWHALIGQSPRVDVIREGPAAPWIYAADALIHTNCTTGVEAVALDRPAICIVPSDVGVNQRYLSNRVNPVVRSAAEAVDAVRRIVADPAGFRYSAEMLRQFHQSLSFEDDRLAAVALLDAIEGRLDPRDFSGPAWNPTWKYRWHQADKNVRGKLMPALDLGLITDHLSRMREMLRLRFDVVVEPVGTKLVHLSARGLAPSVRWRRRLNSLISLRRHATARKGSARS